MKFSVGSIFGRLGRKSAAPEGPRIVGRTEFGGEFSIGYNESAVVESLIVTNMGAVNGKLDIGLKAGERNGRVELPLKQDSGAQGGQWWFEYSISPVSVDPMQRAKLVVRRACQGAKPSMYDTDFWLKAGDVASFEHGLMIRNKSTSRSRQGEFTNVVLELDDRGQKKEVTLVSFAKGKNFVYAQTKNSASFGPFDITLTSASENEAVLKVRRSSELFV